MPRYKITIDELDYEEIIEAESEEEAEIEAMIYCKQSLQDMITVNTEQIEGK